jgi:hypothetical protein
MIQQESLWLHLNLSTCAVDACEKKQSLGPSKCQQQEQLEATYNGNTENNPQEAHILFPRGTAPFNPAAFKCILTSCFALG